MTSRYQWQFALSLSCLAGAFMLVLYTISRGGGLQPSGLTFAAAALYAGGAVLAAFFLRDRQAARRTDAVQALLRRSIQNAEEALRSAELYLGALQNGQVRDSPLIASRLNQALDRAEGALDAIDELPPNFLTREGPADAIRRFRLGLVDLRVALDVQVASAAKPATPRPATDEPDSPPPGA